MLRWSIQMSHVVREVCHWMQQIAFHLTGRLSRLAHQLPTDEFCQKAMLPNGTWYLGRSRSAFPTWTSISSVESNPAKIAENIRQWRWTDCCYWSPKLSNSSYQKKVTRLHCFFFLFQDWHHNGTRMRRLQQRNLQLVMILLEVW